MKSIPKPFYILMVLAMLFGMLGMQPVKAVQAISPDVRISQAYGAGGNSGAIYKNDFIELYNSSTAAVSVDGWSVQYASSAGTSWQVTVLSGTIPANSYYLIQEAPGAGDMPPLPTPDATGVIAMQGSSNFKIALVNSTTALSGSCPTGVIDLLGGGTANCFEGSAAPGTTSATALIRKQGGCQDTDVNANDFEALTPTPRNTASPAYVCPVGDTAPTVAGTVPTNSGTAQKSDNIVITFSEPVTVTDPWFSISCTTSGAHSAVVTDADPVFTLNPNADFTVGETCTVTIDHTKVNDDDLDDATADYMIADYSFSFTIAAGCGDPYTFIYDIQGTGTASPVVGTTVTTEGVVVGDFQVGGKNGYYIQEPNADADPLTSNGIFVYNTSVGVNVGDRVRVTGLITEWATGTGGTMTELTPTSPAGSNVLLCSTGNSVAATEVTLPVTAVSDFEQYESMLVTFPQSLIISEYFNFDRYGEIVLTSTRHMTPTALVEPGAPAQAEAAAYLLDRITLDDGRTAQNPDPAIHPNGLTFDMTNLFRGGGTVTNVTGILDFYQSLYRVQPTTGAVYADANPRTTAPDITEADLKVVSFNVLNYFVTLDDGVNDICGPSGTLECRGADNEEEFTRQKAKIVAALAAIDADVYGLMEIENDSPVAVNDAVADLVAGLNAVAGAGTYAYIQTGAIGGDVIKQAILYKPASVTPVGTYQILDSTVDSRFIDTANRPVLAQVFASVEGGNTFVVAVNHLKSKGSACVGDPDLGDGQGNCNLTRLAAAQALVDWLANPTYFPEVEKALIIGDLNSYDKEDPIDAIKLGVDDTAATTDDYLDMIFEKQGDNAYGYVYDGQTGYLDHALANQALAENIVDVNFWHINADEPDLIDYDTSFKKDAQDALYAPDAYRSSDHDPVLVTLDVFTLEEQITAAVDYVYDPVYPYVGLINFDDPNNIFTGTYTDAQFLAGGAMDDLARYLGALYRQENSSINSIVFDGVTYTWNVDGGLKGSNWEDTSGNTLVSAMVDYFFGAAYDPAVGLQIAVSDEVATSTVTFMLINEYAALTWLQMNTVLSSVSGTIADLKATFPSTIPANIVDLPYVIDSRMTLAAALPVGSTVTIYREGVAIPGLTDITLDGDGPFWFTELFVPGPAPRAPFDANYGNAIENYVIEVTGPGGNILDFDTTVLIESVISKDGYLTETVLDDITLAVNIPADELAALDWLQANTVLSSVSGTIADLKATFPASIPPVIVAEDYVIDSRMTLAEALPVGSTVTIYREGVAVLTDITLDGVGPFWFTELFDPGPAPRAPFDAGYGGAVENYVIVVTGPGNNPLDFDTTVLIESVISKDGYDTETVLDDITLGIHIDDAVAPTIESGVAHSSSHDDVPLVDGAFTVVQGFVVDTIEITMDEDVLVTLGTVVTMEDYGPYGTVTAHDGAVITITPYSGYETAALIGTFTFTVPAGSVTDLRGNAFVGSIALEVLNVAPVAMDDAYTTDEDVTLTIDPRGVLANDTDFDPVILTAILVDEPANGTVVLNSDGSFTYTPDPDFTGTDTFTYTANDGMVDSNIATVTITVTPINDVPVAVDDAYSVNEDGVLTVAAPGVMANDIEVDTDGMVVVLVSNVSHGSLVLLGDGSFTYTPDPDFNGTDSFVYKLITYPGLQDAWTDDATVTITVNPVNDAPVAEDQDVTTAEDTAKAITLTGSDIDGDTLTFSIVDDPLHGDVVLAGSVATYTPDPDFTGEDSFTFTATDGTATSDMAVVTITVTPVNDAPVTVEDVYTTDEDTVLTVPVADGVLANDTDVDGDVLTAVLVSDVSFGTLTLADDGSFVYTPDENYSGTDFFSYKASDGTPISNVVDVSITVNPVNDWVVANDDEYETMAGVTLDVAAPGVLTNDVLLDPNETVTLDVLVQPTGGTLTLNADGSFTYVPNAGFFGVDTFEYQLNSTLLQGEFSDTAIVTITVTAMQIFLPLILR